MTINVHVSKGLDILLDKVEHLDRITVGLSWNEPHVDLDATVWLLDEYRILRDIAYYRKLKSNCGSVVHQGDARSGGAVSYDEVVEININTIPDNIKELAISLSSHSSHTFKNVPESRIDVITTENSYEYLIKNEGYVAPKDPSKISRLDSRGIIVCRFVRDIDGMWVYKPSEEIYKDFEDIVKALGANPVK